MRALIIEDHVETRDWLAAILDEAFPGIHVESVSTIAAARRLVLGGDVDFLLIDLSLPDGSGVDVVTLAQKRLPHAIAMVVTIYDDDEHLFAALEAGAAGYVLKDQPRQRLIEQFRGAMRGEPALSPGIARRLLRHFARGPGRLSGTSQHGLLPREVEILKLIAGDMTRKDIAERLHLSPNTVAGYVKEIYRKLEVSGRSGAVLKALRLGLIDAE